LLAVLVLLVPARALAATHLTATRSGARIVLRLSTSARGPIVLLVDGKVVARTRHHRTVLRLPVPGAGRHRVVARAGRVVLARRAFVVSSAPHASRTPLRIFDPPNSPDLAAPRLDPPPAMLTGRVALTASVSPDGARAVVVDFLVDDAIVGSDTTAPYSYTLDAATIPAGDHGVAVRETRVDGSQATSASTFVASSADRAPDAVATSFPSLAAAVRSLPTGGVLYVPAGTYDAAGLDLPSGIVVVGAGEGRTILRAPAGSAGDFVLKTHGAGNVIASLTIDANAAAAGAGVGWAIDVGPGSSGTLIQHVTVVNARTTGIYLWGEHHGVSIQDVTIEGAGLTASGVSDHIDDPTSGDTSVLRSTIEHVRDYGINLFPWTPTTTYPGARAVAIGNVIHDVTDPAIADGTAEGGIWSGGEDAYIADNLIDTTGWDGIETFGQSNRTRVVDNVISNTRYGIYLEHSTNDSLFAGNQITGVERNGINVEWRYGGVGSARDTFRQNTIVGAVSGIFVDLGADQMVIEGNAILDSREQAVALQGAHDAIVRGNDLRDRRGAASETYGVRELAGRADTGALVLADSNTITGNDARGATAGAVRLIGVASRASANRWP
jgi:parallel beta-helix repeat protein